MLLAATTLLLATSVCTSDDWTTPAEASDYQRTPRYAETMAYFERLDAASPAVTLIEMGRSAQGRAMQAVILASEGISTPEAARATGKPVILIQAAIHPGENEGKDALMALARDLALGGDAPLLEPVILVLVPIFNVDGHERFSPYNRINQNGPEAMGWRATAQNLNLNRDYTKADSPEMQAWLRLWQRWQPDLLVDMHNTNGADYQYAMTWAYEFGPNIHPALVAWQRAVYDGAVKPKLAAQGWPVAYYVAMKEWGNLSAGLIEGTSTPRFSVGYAAAAGRPGLLLETHMVKDFRTRVAVNAALLRELLRAIGRDPGALKSAVAKADDERFAPGAKIPLAFGLSERSEPMDFLGYKEIRESSEISGAEWVRYDQGQAVTLSLPVQREITITASTAAPAAYLVPVQWTSVIERLHWHGVKMQRLPDARTVSASRHRFGEVAWAPRPFEGRHMLTQLESTLETIEIEVPAGSWVIPMDQPRARLITQLLEPAAPDSFIRWGFFDAIFEEKEYAEARVLEGIARQMLAADPALKAEFDERLKDEAFAADPRARLRFFYERSPYFDSAWKRYPVLRLDAEALGVLLAR
jgi:murein tripeptide amidase MpaA